MATMTMTTSASAMAQLARDDGVDGEIKLALAVIEFALRDLVDANTDKEALVARARDGQASLRADARAFFSEDNEMLGFWCGVIGVDPGYLLRVLPRLIERQRQARSYLAPTWKAG